MRLISNLLLLIGLLCYVLTTYFLWQRTNPQLVSFHAYQPEKHVTITQKTPLSIEIKRINSKLPIIPTQINNGEWQTTTKGVSYLNTSPLPGNQGNSILYGHNWSNLLGRLIEVKPDDEILISFSDRSTQRFIVEYTMTVTPDQVHILAPSKDNRITLYTCTGFLDSKRFVVVAIAQDKAL